MDVRIGVIQTPKELILELSDEDDRDALRTRIDAALTGGTTVLWLTDKKGREVGIPTERIAYVDIGLQADRPIGFGAT